MEYRAPVFESTAIPTIVQLDASAPAALLTQTLPDARIIRFGEGEFLPPLTSISHLVVLGGESSAYDKALAPVAQLLTQAVDAGVPTLGICLGAQLLAVATGGAVEVDAPSGPENGIVEIRLRPDAAQDPVLGRVAERLGRDLPVVTMHADAITDLPPKATWLASSTQYPFQAFRIGSALGVQFHPEADAGTYAGWLERKTGADPSAARAEWAAHADSLTALLESLTAGLLATEPLHLAN
ncbi:type 1 glutamine amidotransferase [Pseudactinotalea sp. HY160]|nr:type 1 glutamine amidotransferase [Pseudactinotalea sp. HY160]